MTLTEETQGPDSDGHCLDVADQSIAWVENQTTFDIKRSMYIKHMKYRDLRLIVTYSRVFDEFAVEEVQTDTGQVITWLIKDRVLDQIERALK